MWETVGLWIKVTFLQNWDPKEQNYDQKEENWGPGEQNWGPKGPKRRSVSINPNLGLATTANCRALLAVTLVWERQRGDNQRNLSQQKSQWKGEFVTNYLSHQQVKNIWDNQKYLSQQKWFQGICHSIKVNTCDTIWNLWELNYNRRQIRGICSQEQLGIRYFFHNCVLVLTEVPIHQKWQWQLKVETQTESRAELKYLWTDLKYKIRHKRS